MCVCVCVCVQESRCLQRYREAISLQQGGEGQRARDLYQEILDSRVMQEVTSLSLPLSLSPGRGRSFNHCCWCRLEGPLVQCRDSNTSH